MSRERIASFHPSLKYASICTLANRGSVFPISREPCLQRFTRDTGSPRKFEMERLELTSNIPIYVPFSRILSAISAD